MHEDPINYVVSGRKLVPDTLAFENEVWRFSRRGGVCLDNPSSRHCVICPLRKTMMKFNTECSMDFRAYGGPRFSQICQNKIDYQRDVVHLCPEKTEKRFQETFEIMFGRPLSPSLVKTWLCNIFTERVLRKLGIKEKDSTNMRGGINATSDTDSFERFHPNLNIPCQNGCAFLASWRFHKDGKIHCTMFNILVK